MQLKKKNFFWGGEEGGGMGGVRVRGAGRGHKKSFAGGVFDVNERLMGVMGVGYVSKKRV